MKILQVFLCPLNFSGRVNNLEEFSKFAKSNNLWILEDSCHSLGGYSLNSENREQKSGSCIYSDLSIFSFHPVKHITSGEGGVITTNNFHYYELIKKLRSHGIEKDHKNFKNKQKKAQAWFMEMHHLGYNYRVSEINLALVNSQLNRADSYFLKRQKIAKYYNKFFKNKKYIIDQSGYIKGHSYHLYIILVKERDELYNFLMSKGIQTQIHYIPAHKMPYYEERLDSRQKMNLNNVEEYYSSCLSLPIFPALKSNQLKYITNCIEEFYE